MANTINYIEEVKKILSDKGVTERKHASTIAMILDIHYNSAKQKLDGKRGITIDEVNKIYNYFKEQNFLKTKSHNCVFIINDIHKRCNIQVTTASITNKNKDSKSYATKKDGIYVINTNHEFINEDIYEVNSIEFLPEPEIAILDNDTDILHLIQKKITSRYGIKSDIFNTLSEIEASASCKDYDAYILDWQLDYGETPEEFIKKIRRNNKKKCTSNNSYW